MKEKLQVIQTTKPSWTIETDAKLWTWKIAPGEITLNLKRNMKMSHERIAKTKFMIYWKTILIGHCKQCHRTSLSNSEEKQEWIAAYSCSIFILEGQNEYFKEL